MAPAVYAGALQPKKKQELQDIALALRLSDQGTKDELHARIKKHLDAHQDALEDDPMFAGLFGRRKRSVQPQSAPASQVLVGRFAPSTSDPDKPRSSAGRRSTAALDPIKEATPTKDLRDVSIFLKHPPASPFESTPAQSPRQVDVLTPSSLPPLPPSPAKSFVETLPKAAEVKAAVEQFKQQQQQQALQNGVELVVALRAFLSNSRNIWSLTSIFELLYIIYVTVPWQSFQIPLGLPAKSLSLPYPPASTFQSSAFWQVILQWALPTLIIPSFLGCMISFNPALAPSALLPASSAPSSSKPPLPAPSAIAPLDPLTASIIRLAAQTSYPYPAIGAYISVSGLDVLGSNWRVLSASVGLAFAFAEAIAGAPQTITKELVRAQRRRLAIDDDEDDAERGHGITRRALTLHENHEASPEVD